MLKIGLTGNIAAGKTQVEKIISSLGFSVIDLDNVSHEILEYNKSAKDEILKEFKTLNRKELGNIIFKNPKKIFWVSRLKSPYPGLNRGLVSYPKLPALSLIRRFNFSITSSMNIAPAAWYIPDRPALNLEVF